MQIKSNLRYANSHEWAELLADGKCRVGISDFAQAAMGDIVFVNLPGVGDTVEAGGVLTDIESVKAVADVYAPVSGTIVAVNEALDSEPELLNTDPYGAWIVELADVQGLDDLMDETAYAQHCEEADD